MPTVTEAGSERELERATRLDEFARLVSIERDDLALLQRALTHRSLRDTSDDGDNERLEFLGDSILALLVCEHVYQSHPELDEGGLTRLKASYVCEASLAIAARRLELGQFISLAASDEAMGGRERSSILSDCFEAILAAIYLCRGLEAARRFVEEHLLAIVDPDEVADHKSRLQELLQDQWRSTPVYKTLEETGPAHDRMFQAGAYAMGVELGRGSGTSKKAAEQRAAAMAMKRLRAGEIQLPGDGTGN